MTKRMTAAVSVAALLSVLAQHPEGLREGPTYSAFASHGMGHSDYVRLTGVLIQEGYVERRGTLLLATATGRALAVEMDAALAAAKVKG